MVAWLEDWLESWETYDAEVEAFVDVPDRVVTLVHHRGRARGSGMDVDHRGALVNTVRDGKVAHPISQSIMPAFRGPEGMEGFAAASAEAWEEFLFEPIAFVPLGDRLLVDLEVRGVGRESGIAVEENWAHLYTIREGHVASFHAFRRRDEALAYPEQP